MIDRKTEPGDTGGHRGDQEERGPPAAVSSTQEADHDDESGGDRHETQDHVHFGERRERHSPDHEALSVLHEPRWTLAGRGRARDEDYPRLALSLSTSAW